MMQKLTDKPIAIAADHRGVVLKARLSAWLHANGYTVTDCGTANDAERVDAMDYARKAVAEIKTNRADFAIAICGSGQMMAITANRFPFTHSLRHSGASRSDEPGTQGQTRSSQAFVLPP